MRSVRQIVAVAAALVIAAAQVTGCTTGEDAVAQGGTFDFVSPGGQTAIFYDPPSSRVTIGDLNGPDLFTDETIWLSDFTGKVVLINVWGSWCAPCRTETPELETVYAEYRDRGVQFLGIDVRDNRDTARDSVTDRNVQYPSIFDPAMRSLITLGRTYPTSVVPTTMVLDRQRVAAVYLMALLAEDLRPLLDRLTTER
ncbi:MULTISPECIES: TlpA family protein disulfide reductase [Mycolicibacterium]|uniref:Redoxin domain-containing protein n=2 Tax=Mycolicibacterium TaxID=1866885 RepID=A0AAV2WLN4_MYCNE|nr:MULTISPECIES: TlpA disulfide reductase family protein [Mycolicibacterium]MCF6388764.1 TlpA family protein disulfide reductase [Mycobacterium sp. MBM]MCP9276363.1 TlpA family protein disulfide reductase [Mycolicibacterium sp. CAU 1645]QZT54950.1 TlpA family protein disulfide reductase [Mycolicibacterium austroafricanum]TLH62609.1 TlpA family protein disulfide reductase [Mycolicibacterium neoaurum]TRW79483.1 TlpA family protein disulfide reductase [Mycolicibacterium sp. 018/SC-01/001]